MKITQFLVLSFLLFAFTEILFPEAVHAEDPEAVIDSEGNEVTAGARYLILPVRIGFETLAISATGRIICNSDVIISPVTNALPIIFSPVVKSNDSVIHEGSYLNVNFDAPTCRMAGVTTMWKMEFRPTSRGFVVTTGGVDRLNRFTITKSSGSNLYQLSFCPMSEPLGESSCVPLGNVANRLAPSANSLPVEFVPIDTSKIKMVSE